VGVSGRNQSRQVGKFGFHPLFNNGWLQGATGQRLEMKWLGWCHFPADLKISDSVDQVQQVIGTVDCVRFLIAR
jgi:hypothetical protein